MSAESQEPKNTDVSENLERVLRKCGTEVALQWFTASPKRREMLERIIPDDLKYPINAPTEDIRAYIQRILAIGKPYRLQKNKRADLIKFSEQCADTLEENYALLKLFDKGKQLSDEDLSRAIKTFKCVIWIEMIAILLQGKELTYEHVYKQLRAHETKISFPLTQIAKAYELLLDHMVTSEFVVLATSDAS